MAFALKLPAVTSESYSNGVRSLTLLFLLLSLILGIIYIFECVFLTAKETKALNKHGRHSADGREAGVLARLSMQSLQVQAEMYQSLQHMRLQRSQLQASLRQQREAIDNNKDFEQNGVGCSNFEMNPGTSNTLSRQSKRNGELKFGRVNVHGSSVDPNV